MKNYLRYLYAISAVPLALLLRAAMIPLIGSGIPYIMLFPVTVGVALLAGLGPAVLTGFLGAIITDYFFIEPLHIIAFDVPHFTRAAVMVLTSIFVGYIGDSLRAARIKAEQQALALRENQKDMNRAQAVAITGSWRLDTQQGKLTWSDEAYNIFSVPKETPLTYELFLTFIHPDDREYVDKSWNAAIKGEKYDIEHRIIVNNEIKWVRERAELELDKDGVLLGGFGTVMDITRLKQTEEELRKSRDEMEQRVKERTVELNQTVETLQDEVRLRISAEKTIKAERKRFEDVLEMMPAYAILLTPDYHVAYANRTFREWFGDDNGKKCYEFLFNRTEPCENCETYNVMKTGKSQFWEWTGPNGNNYDIYDYPFTDTDGSPLIMEIGVDVTAHKQAQTALRLGEERYRSLTEATSQIVWTTDADGQVVGDMPSWREFTGQSVEELKSWGWINSLHPDDKERTAKIWSNAVEKRILYETEYRIRRQDGEYRDMAVRGVPVLEFDGSIREWVGTCTDITEQKKTQEALRSASIYARSLIEASLDPLVTISQDGKITDVNEATIEVTGVGREKLIGTDFLDYFTEPQKAREGYKQVFANGFVTDYPLTIRHKNGKLSDVLYNAAVYKDTHGKVIGVFAAARDITAKRIAERRQGVTNSMLGLFATKISRKEYIDSAVKLIKDWSGSEFIGIRIKDKNGNIPYESCVGFDKEFLALENPLNLKHDKCVCIRTITQKSFDPENGFVTHAGSFFCNDSKVFLNELSEQQKKEYRGNCIKWGFQSIAIIPIRYHQDIIGAVHITDFKKDMVPLPKVQFIESTIAPLIGEAINRFNAEAELEKYRLHLEEMVKHRTEELARSNKDLEQFAYVASHDLQEPLRMVAGYTQLIQRRYSSKLDEDANQFIHFTVDGVVRMQNLINDLLAYSRLNTSTETLEPVDCRAVLDEVMAAIQMTIEESGAAINLGPMPTIQADRTQLFQLFQNLIGNAIKFRSDKPPLINITAKPQGKQWLFSVSDNGIGMEPQYLERIFVIFQRLHTQDKYSGTGIGLAICKKIVERHGGRIWVESQPGKGTIFYFTI